MSAISVETIEASSACLEKNDMTVWLTFDLTSPTESLMEVSECDSFFQNIL